ncbi:hypothetical protein N9Z37_00535, partial [bacterium]|nr:hypothetical protein [bacterium]
MRFLSHLPLLTSALFLTSVIELAAEVDVRDQVIKLRLKEMARADRLPIPSHKDSTSTAIPVDPDLPSTSPGSIWSAEKFSEDALAQLKRLSLAPDEILTDGFLSSELESTNQGPPSNLSIHSGTPEAANE